MAASVGRRAYADRGDRLDRPGIGHLRGRGAQDRRDRERADFDDFDQLSYRPGNRFTIVPVGSFFGSARRGRSCRRWPGCSTAAPIWKASSGALHRRAAG